MGGGGRPGGAGVRRFPAGRGGAGARGASEAPDPAGNDAGPRGASPFLSLVLRGTRGGGRGAPPGAERPGWRGGAGSPRRGPAGPPGPPRGPPPAQNTGRPRPPPPAPLLARWGRARGFPPGRWAGGGGGGGGGGGRPKRGGPPPPASACPPRQACRAGTRSSPLRPRARRADRQRSRASRLPARRRASRPPGSAFRRTPDRPGIHRPYRPRCVPVFGPAPAPTREHEQIRSDFGCIRPEASDPNTRTSTPARSAAPRARALPPHAFFSCLRQAFGTAPGDQTLDRTARHRTRLARGTAAQHIGLGRQRPARTDAPGQPECAPAGGGVAPSPPGGGGGGGGGRGGGAATTLGGVCGPRDRVGGGAPPPTEGGGGPRDPGGGGGGGGGRGGFFPLGRPPPTRPLRRLGCRRVYLVT